MIKEEILLLKGENFLSLSLSVKYDKRRNNIKTRNVVYLCLTVNHYLFSIKQGKKIFSLSLCVKYDKRRIILKE